MNDDIIDYFKEIPLSMLDTLQNNKQLGKILADRQFQDYYSSEGRIRQMYIAVGISIRVMENDPEFSANVKSRRQEAVYLRKSYRDLEETVIAYLKDRGIAILSHGNINSMPFVERIACSLLSITESEFYRQLLEAKINFTTYKRYAPELTFTYTDQDGNPLPPTREELNNKFKWAEGQIKELEEKLDIVTHILKDSK